MHDLHAADAVYHQTCNGSVGKHRSPRDQNSVDERTAAFLEVARYLEENDDEQITIDDLIDLMRQKLENTANVAYNGCTHT